MLQQLLVLTLLLPYASLYVQELTDADFYNYAKDKEVLLVDFYAPWCGDCQRIEPEIQGAANILGGKSADLAKVDCFGAGKGLCAMYGVKSWPQLKNFNKGTYTGDYTGAQTAAAMSNYINTVESSVTPQVNTAPNPYAMAYPVPASPPAYNHAAFPSAPVAPAPPIVGALSCAKCNINMTPGRINRHCSKSVKKACVEMKIREEEKKKYDDDDKKRTIQH